MALNPQLTPQAFAADVLPGLVERWQRRCFCSSPGFLKLLSFDFRDCGNTPAELIDSEMAWDAIVGKRFVPVGDWSEVSGESQRTFRCPQCGSEMLTRSEQYSINMWPATSRPTDARVIAPTGLYLVGIRYLQGFDPKSVHDFRLAGSVDEYIASITGGG
jgi:hypothetical protein